MEAELADFRQTIEQIKENISQLEERKANLAEQKNDLKNTINDILRDLYRSPMISLFGGSPKIKRKIKRKG
jgi:septal ring factor EnvC (AmiA/AmiB activator)